MDTSLAIQKVYHHARAISLSSSRSHPLTLRIEEQFCRLRSSELATTSSSICHNLVLLQDLYESVDELIQLPHTLSEVSLLSEGQVDQVLDGSLKLLDVCRITKETLSQMKQSVQDLQSSLRRRGADSEFANIVRAYMTVKHVTSDTDYNMISILSEVQTITLAVFKSLMSLASSANANESTWSFISKLKHARSTKEGKVTTEMEKVDALLKTLSGHKSCKDIEKKDAKKSLEALEISLPGLEDGLDCLFMFMIKARVSLLNIQNLY